MHPDVVWVLSRQGIAVVVVAAITAVFAGAGAAVSLLVGGVIGILGAGVYVLRALRGGERDPGRAFQAQVRGEAMKFVVVFGGFALVFLVFKRVAALPLFLGFAITVVIYWMALLKIRQ